MLNAPSRESSAWKTPLYEQFWSLKDKCTGALLFFRLGDFYELFGEDALIAAPLLEIQLTARNKNHPDPIPMCGVPVGSFEGYAEKILAAGHKIAIADQIEEAGAGKKLVERDLVRILTPGLPVDFERLHSKEAHWLVSLARKPRSKEVEVVVFDLLGSRLHAGQIDRSDELQDLLQRLQPREILMESSWFADSKALKEWGFDQDLEESTMSMNLSGLKKCHWTPWGTRDAQKNLEEYLCYTQRKTTEELSDLLPEARGLKLLSGQKNETYAHMPQSVLEQWAVFPELFELMDFCGSVVGSRRLRDILSRPLLDSARICVRQNLLKDELDYASFLDASKDVYDFERLLGRFRLGVATSLELLRFRTSLESSLKALQCLDFRIAAWTKFLKDENLQSGFESFPTITKLLSRINEILRDDVEPQKGTGSVELIRKGYDTEFDRLKVLDEDGATWLNEYQEKLKKELGIPTLKVRSNRVFGYYIEVTKAHSKKMPSDFERKQTTVNGERFSSEVLREREREILSASAKLDARAHSILDGLCDEIKNSDKSLRDFVELFSWADAFAGVLKAMQKLKAFGPWVWPQVENSSEAFFEIYEARHPLLEAYYGDFVPNSISLKSSAHRLMLLTGPNMAGKSTLMRQTGLCLLLGQCGFPVPAEKMIFTPCSGFYSRMGASDRILAGESTFMVEMKETASILRDADNKSFVLIDEIGRGTSTTDGLSIARAVLEFIHDRSQSLCVFATHYHELSEDALRLKNAFNASMGIREWNGSLVFLRKLVFEAAQSSYGLYVAQWAGLPTRVLNRAKKELHRLTEVETQMRGVAAGDQDQMNLFSAANRSSENEPEENLQPNSSSHPHAEEEHEIINALSQIDLDTLSPREAWSILDEKIAKIREFSSQSKEILPSDSSLTREYDA